MKQRQVLLVEPDLSLAEPLAFWLRSQGYRPEMAATVKDAMLRAVHHPPGIVLLDLDLPDADGLGLLEAMRASEQLAHIPAVILTRRADKQTVLRAAELGACGYLLKQAFSLSQLDAKLQAARWVRVGTPTVVGSDPEPRASGKPSPALESPPEADPAETLRALKPVLARPDLVEAVERGGELRAMSPTVTQILKLTSNPRVSADSVVKTIKLDHAVALKIMKLANSSVFARGEPVSSVQRAVTRLGMEQVRQVVMNIGVMESFANAALPEGMTLPGFWQHAMAVGLIAAEIAAENKAFDAETAFTLGLLHDVGRLVLAEQLPEKYAEVAGVAQRSGLSLHEVEKRMLLDDHAEVMERLLRTWGMPRDLAEPIVLHHASMGTIRRQSPSRMVESATLALADRLASAMLLGHSGSGSVYSTRSFIEALTVPDRVLTRIIEQVPSELSELKLAMLAGEDADVWRTRADSLRERLNGRFDPVVISPDPLGDPVQLLCNELRSGIGEASEANLLVVHLPDAGQRAAVSNLIRTAEAEDIGRRLPMLVLSPAETIMPDQSLLEGRVHRRLRMPFRVDRFIEHCNALHGAEATPLRRAG
ncbi:MAG: HDOD domain-containing protein [Phycisphaerales bacterium]|nr:MAG: HDOD domain-containing protein [Phycisphaerales bacterium]